MSVLPHRTEKVLVPADQQSMLVHYVHERPVAFRFNNHLTVYQNPFPDDDPRWASTAVALDLLDGGTPGALRWREPWRADLVEAFIAKRAARAARQAEQDRIWGPLLEEDCAPPRRRRKASPTP